MPTGNTHYTVTFIATYFRPKKGKLCKAKITQIDETMILLNWIELLRVIVPIESVNTEKYSIKSTDLNDDNSKQILLEGDIVTIKIESIQPGNIVYGSLE